MKLPAFQFYPGDWRKDPGVQSLDYEARGVWFEILCLMHEAEPRGMLTLAGKAMSDEALARLLGLDKHHLNQILSKLAEHGVSSVDPATGALCSRRMIKDENLRQIRQNAGKKGGNPVLVKQNPTTVVKQNPTPSSSPSSSPSVNTSGAAKPPRERVRDELFDALALADGSDPKQLTAAHAQRIGVALAQIRKACPDLAPAEIQRRSRIYASVMPSGTRCTASALAANWAKCGGAPLPRQVAPGAVEDAPPANWRVTMERLYPDNAVNRENRSWAEVPDAIKAEVRAQS